MFEETRSKSLFLAISLMFIVFAILGSLASAQYEAWYDEIFTLFYVQHDIPFAAVVRSRWLNDIHPPTFYLLGWITHDFVGSSIFIARIMNVFYLAIPIVLALAMINGTTRGRSFYFYAVCIALGSMLTLSMLIEFRSNLLSISMIFCLVIMFYAADSETEIRAVPKLHVMLLIQLALFTSFSIHYISSIATGMLVASFILYWALSGRQRWSLYLTLMAIIGGMPVVGWWVMEHQLTTQVSQTFWATTSPVEAKWDIERFVEGLLVANAFVSLIAGVAAINAIITRSVQSRSFMFGVTCSLALLLALLSFYILNIWVPFLQPRYLSALLPIGAGAIAAFASLPTMRLWMAVVATMISTITVTANAMTLKKRSGWNVSAAVAKAAAKNCASTAVHARSFYDMEDTLFKGLPGEAAVNRFGYERAARLAKLPIEPARGSRVPSLCPTILWVEHQVPAKATAAQLALRARLNVTNAAASHAKIWRSSGAIVIAYPPGFSS